MFRSSGKRTESALQLATFLLGLRQSAAPEQFQRARRTSLTSCQPSLTLQEEASSGASFTSTKLPCCRLMPGYISNRSAEGNPGKSGEKESDELGKSPSARMTSTLARPSWSKGAGKKLGKAADLRRIEMQSEELGTAAQGRRRGREKSRRTGTLARTLPVIHTTSVLSPSHLLLLVSLPAGFAVALSLQFTKPQSSWEVLR
mmetsp:Transcript_34874/g.78803  ORF Transcript_34874/g.78803 Transcript_34874/m.78803 type:complete len:202 (-) Transcript_34874:1330-1935(-)